MSFSSPRRRTYQRRSPTSARSTADIAGLRSSSAANQALIRCSMTSRSSESKASLTSTALDQRADGEVGIEPAQAGGGQRPGIAAGALGRVDAHLPCQRIVREELPNVGGIHGRIATLDEETSAPVFDDGAQSTNGRGHDGSAAGGRFERHETE